MPVFRITRTGLIAISFAVCALWGCLALEQIELRHARRDAVASVRILHQLRENAVPVADPVKPFRFHRPSNS